MILTTLYTPTRGATAADATERAQEDTNHDYNNHDSYLHDADADPARIAEDRISLKISSERSWTTISRDASGALLAWPIKPSQFALIQTA